MKPATTLAEIEQSARVYSQHRKLVSDTVKELEGKIAALHRQYLPRLRSGVAAAAEAETNLKELVQSAPGLFTKPRTVIFHGIKLGYAKGKGGISWKDADKVVGLIHKHYPGEEGTAFLHITEKPDKEALAKLSVADLKKLGCEVVATGDTVVVKSTESEIDKIVTALLKGTTEDVMQAEAA